jgi:hypothetical protein
VRLLRLVLLPAVAALLVSVRAVAAPGPECRPPSATKLRYENGRLSARIEDASLRDVLDALRRETGAEIIGGDVEGGPVRQRFDRVPLREALARFLGLGNFALRYEHGQLVSIHLLSSRQARPAPQAVAPVAAPSLRAAESGPIVLGSSRPMPRAAETERPAATAGPARPAGPPAARARASRPTMEEPRGAGRLGRPWLLGGSRVVYPSPPARSSPQVRR